MKTNDWQHIINLQMNIFLQKYNPIISNLSRIACILNHVYKIHEALLLNRQLTILSSLFVMHCYFGHVNLEGISEAYMCLFFAKYIVAQIFYYGIRLLTSILLYLFLKCVV